jgi:hypothetical protein
MKKMNPLIGQSLIGAGSSVLGMIGQHIGRNQALKDQQGLMNQQMQNQMMLNQQGHNLQMDMWNKTNYGAQVEHMKKAGLNVGLMYGGGGAGGTTTGSQGGGSAAGGNAPAPMDIGNMVMQGQMLASQIKVNEAQAKKLEADAERTSGSGKMGEIDYQNIAQGINNSKAVESLTKTQNDIAGLEWELKGATIDKQKELVNQMLLKVEKENYILEKQGQITKVEADNVLEKTKLQIVGMQIDNMIGRSQNENIKANTEKIKEETNVIFRDYLTRAKNANTSEREMLNRQTEQELNRIMETEKIDIQDRQKMTDQILDILTIGAYGNSMSTLPPIRGFGR